MVFGRVIVVVLVAVSLGAKAERNLILGGMEAPDGRYPYVVRLSVISGKMEDRRVFTCTGSLVAPDLVLTSGHCLKRPGGNVPIHAAAFIGCRSRNASNNECPGYYVRSENFIVHPCYMDDKRNCYQETKRNDDIALLKLSSPSDITPIRLATPDQKAPKTGDSITLLGWGVDGDSPDRSSEHISIHMLESSYYSTDDCNALYSEYAEENIEFCIPEWTQWATGNGKGSFCNRKGNTAHCQGDSGGPWIVPGGSSAKDTVVGIVQGTLGGKGECSWIVGDSEEFEDVAIGRDVSIAYHYNWLRTAICENSKFPPDYLECKNRDTKFLTDIDSLSCPKNPYSFPFEKRNIVSRGDQDFAMLGYSKASDETCGSALVCVTSPARAWWDRFKLFSGNLVGASADQE